MTCKLIEMKTNKKTKYLRIYVRTISEQFSNNVHCHRQSFSVLCPWFAENRPSSLCLLGILAALRSCQYTSDNSFKE